MKQLIPAITVPLLSGCVALPIPHTEQVSPEFFGVVTDAETGESIGGADVLLVPLPSGVEEKPNDVSVKTNADGSYRVRVTSFRFWYRAVLAPAHGFCRATPVVSRQGYAQESTSENRYRVASFAHPCDGYRVEYNVKLSRAKTS